jgi:hypothetical protein
MLLLSFAGMLVMFIFVIRSQSSQTAVLREWFRQQKTILTDVEQQMMNIHFTLRQIQLKKGEAPENKTNVSLPPEDLRDLFSPLPGGVQGRDAGPPPAEAGPERSYPSAAGLDPVDPGLDDFLSLPKPSSRKRGGRGPLDLDLRLER